MSAIYSLAERIDALCSEYLFYVKAMSDGSLEPDEYNTASSYRSIVHDELLQLTGLTRENTHMPNWARERLNRS